MADSISLKKTLKENNRPIGAKSPNLVTLITSVKIVTL
jgi:hypothetical protein